MRSGSSNEQEKLKLKRKRRAARKQNWNNKKKWNKFDKNLHKKGRKRAGTTNILEKDYFVSPRNFDKDKALDTLVNDIMRLNDYESAKNHYVSLVQDHLMNKELRNQELLEEIPKLFPKNSSFAKNSKDLYDNIKDYEDKFVRKYRLNENYKAKLRMGSKPNDHNDYELRKELIQFVFDIYKLKLQDGRAFMEYLNDNKKARDEFYQLGSEKRKFLKKEFNIYWLSDAVTSATLHHTLARKNTEKNLMVLMRKTMNSKLKKVDKDIISYRKEELNLSSLKKRRLSLKSVQNESQKKGDNPCWDGYEQRGMKRGKDGKLVPNCVPIKKAADDPQTPAPKKDRIRGSDKNPSGSASGQRGGIKLSKDVLKSIENKVKEHNEKVKKEGLAEWRKLNVGQAKAVVRRGLGAYSSSHRPSVTSRTQWGIARLNAFIHLLLKDKPKNPKYVTDNDLLPKKHPRYSSEKKDLDVFDTVVKIFQEEDLRDLDVYQKTIEIFGVEQQDAIMVSKFNTLTNSKVIENDNPRSLVEVAKEMQMLFLGESDLDIIRLDEITNIVKTMEDDIIEKQLQNTQAGRGLNRAQIIEEAITEFGNNRTLQAYLKERKRPERSKFYGIKIPKQLEKERGQRKKLTKIKERARQAFGGRSKRANLEGLRRLQEKLKKPIKDFTDEDIKKIRNPNARRFVAQAVRYEKLKEKRKGATRDKVQREKEEKPSLRQEVLQSVSRGKIGKTDQQKEEERFRKLQNEIQDGKIVDAYANKFLFSSKEVSGEILQRDYRRVLNTKPNFWEKVLGKSTDFVASAIQQMELGLGDKKSDESFRQYNLRNTLSSNFDNIEKIFKDRDLRDVTNETASKKDYVKQMNEKGSFYKKTADTFFDLARNFNNSIIDIEASDLLDNDQKENVIKDKTKKFMDEVIKLNNSGELSKNKLKIFPDTMIKNDQAVTLDDTNRIRDHLNKHYFRTKDGLNRKMVKELYQANRNTFKDSIANHLAVYKIEETHTVNKHITEALASWESYDHSTQRKEARDLVKKINNIDANEDFDDEAKKKARNKLLGNYYDSLQESVNNSKFKFNMLKSFGQAGKGKDKMSGNTKVNRNSYDRLFQMAQGIAESRSDETKDRWVKRSAEIYAQQERDQEKALQKRVDRLKKETEQAYEANLVLENFEGTPVDQAMLQVYEERILEEGNKRADRINGKQAQRRKDQLFKINEKNYNKEINRVKNELEKPSRQQGEAGRNAKELLTAYNNHGFVKDFNKSKNQFDYDKIENETTRKNLVKLTNNNINALKSTNSRNNIPLNFIPKGTTLEKQARDAGFSSYVSTTSFRLKEEGEENYPFEALEKVDPALYNELKAGALENKNAELQRSIDEFEINKNPDQRGTNLNRPAREEFVKQEAAQNDDLFLSNDGRDTNNKMIDALKEMKSIYSPEEPEKKSINDLLNDMKNLYEE